MAIYHEEKAIFIHIWKTGGTGLAKFLEKQRGMVDATKPKNEMGRLVKRVKHRLGLKVLGKHDFAIDIRASIGEEAYSEYFKFAFVRHPYSWLWSYYNFVKSGSLSPEGGRRWQHHLKARICSMDFSDFVEWVVNEDGLNDSFVRKKSIWKDKKPFNQVDWLCDEEGDLIVDYVGKYENIQKCTEEICASLNVRFESLPVVNKSPVNSNMEIKDKDKDLIAEYFAKDFMVFGYDK